MGTVTQGFFQSMRGQQQLQCSSLSGLDTHPDGAFFAVESSGHVGLNCSAFVFHNVLLSQAE